MSTGLLCVTAHPDDEAGNFGGTLCRYSEAGVEIHLICLTSGEAARNRGGAQDNAELMAMRQGELAASCQLLGVADHETWTYPDSGLRQFPFEPLAGKLVEVIRRRRPRVVLTLGPEGSATAHPDHGMAGLLTTAAFHWAAHERYYPELGLAPYQADRLFYTSGVWQPLHRPRVLMPPPDTVIDVHPWIERKLRAFRCHTSQSALFARVEEYIHTVGGEERFHLAAAPLGFDRRLVQSDLLAGLSD